MRLRRRRRAGLVPGGDGRPRRRARSDPRSSLLPEVDAHDDPAESRTADLGESGVGENAATADMELAPGDLLPRLRDHRIALEGSSAAFPRKIDGGTRERAADPPSAEAHSGDEAGHGPDPVVALVFSSARPRDAGLAQQARIGAARFHRAPADGLSVEVGDETARRARLRVAAVGLRARPERELFGADRGPGLPRLHLVSLALASGRIAARAEHRLKILPARL